MIKLFLLNISTHYNFQFFTKYKNYIRSLQIYRFLVIFFSFVLTKYALRLLRMLQSRQQFSIFLYLFVYMFLVCFMLLL